MFQRRGRGDESTVHRVNRRICVPFRLSDVTEYDEAESAHEVSRRRDQVEELSLNSSARPTINNTSPTLNANRPMILSTAPNSGSTIAWTMPSVTIPKTMVNPTMKLVKTNSSSD